MNDPGGADPRRVAGHSDASEQLMAGGYVNTVARVGDTVRRPAPPAADFVRTLLRVFEQHGWSGAPRYLGVDEQGREMLSFIDGHVPGEAEWPPQGRAGESLAKVARLVREFHDLTEHTELAGDQEVVCHNDLSPKNTVYRDTASGLRPVAFIDWDLAGPGRRIHDVAHVCWQYVGLGPGVTGATEAARLVRLIADAYGLTDRRRLVETMLWWQNRCWRGIEAAAKDGDPAMVRLRNQGGARRVRAAHRWTERHRQTLEQALI